MTVYRIYSEKKTPYAIEAKQLAREIRDYLGIPGLENLRILNRYDVEGIHKDIFDTCRTTVFSEPQVDDAHDEIPAGDFCFAVEFLPGQYDQRADSCAQCIQIVSGGERPLVRTAKVYLLYGALGQNDINRIKKYMINPVESREVAVEPFQTLTVTYDTPLPVETIQGFIEMGEKEQKQFLTDWGLAMDLADLQLCQNYFCSEKRNPTVTEIRMIDTYWSDHCRHTTFLTRIDGCEINDNDVNDAYGRYQEMRRVLGREDKPVTLMDLATIGAKYLSHTGQLTGLDLSEEVNACSVHTEVNVDGRTEPWLLMFKNETHNHPTEIEPFGGASTCVGGAIRDPLSGRAYVYQAMRVTGGGDPLTPYENTLEGKLPQRKLLTVAAAGNSSYGNQIGLAAGLAEEICHPGYVAKRMELGAILAATPANHVVRETPVPGDLVILLGGRTGRDGIGGAIGSSKSHSVDSHSLCSAEVQRGNPPEERKIQRLFREEKVARMIKRCNDFGAGGVSVAIGELADGLFIHLDDVPVKYDGLNGTELALSESQERMALVLSPKDLDEFMDWADRENLEATVIARVTEEPRLVMEWQGQTIVDISREFLSSNGTPKHANVRVAKSPAGLTEKSVDSGSASLKDAFISLLTDQNICSRKGLIERFDATAGAGTVLMPLGGQYQATPIQAMVAKLPVVSGDTTTCSVMAYGFNPFLSSRDPYRGAYLAVVESASKLVAAGAGLAKCYLSFQEYFEKLGSDPTRWGKPFAALLGALDAQKDLAIGSVGGKDSMSGSYEDIDVPPTLVSFAVSVCHINNVISPEFKAAGSKVILLSPVYRENGLPGSESLADCLQTLERLIRDKKVKSAYAISHGGMAEAIFKMSLGNRIGIQLSPDVTREALFSIRYGAFLLEMDGFDRSGDDPAFSVEESANGEPNRAFFREIGETTAAYSLSLNQETIGIQELEAYFYSELASVYPFESNDENSPLVRASASHKNANHTCASSCEEIPSVAYKTPGYPIPAFKTAKPRVLIPVFPGTNCEYETLRGLELAGADPELLILKNLTADAVNQSIDALTEQLSLAHMLVIPGGSSGGDEPDGSGKFITAFLRNPKVAEQIHHLLDKRDGLILGIGNGFQALIKLGLVPFGRITEMDENCPTLTFNRIGRLQSKLVHTRISSNKSPWFMNAEIGEVYTLPIGYGEGRFVAADSMIRQLAANGQIAAQYADLSGKPSMDVQYNPGESLYAVESLCSPDGRVLGKMAHTERYSKGLYKNVPGKKEQPLFENGVRYFSL